MPALQQLKLVAGLELRGGRDLQMYRVELPGPKVTKDIPADAKVTLAIPRSSFNELATKGHVKQWREAPRTVERRITREIEIASLQPPSIDA